MSREKDEANGEEAVELPIDGTLDLHCFEPGDAEELLRDYITACLERDIRELRIVHGKGKGVLRRIVHAVLDEHPAVLSYGHRQGAGAWGATVVQLIPPSGED